MKEKKYTGKGVYESIETLRQIVANIPADSVGMLQQIKKVLPEVIKKLVAHMAAEKANMISRTAKERSRASKRAGVTKAKKQKKGKAS